MTLTIHFAPPFVISVLDVHVDSIPYHFYTERNVEPTLLRDAKSHYNTVKP